MVQKRLLLSATFGALAIAAIAMASSASAQTPPEAQAPPATQAPAIAPAPLPQLASPPTAAPPATTPPAAVSEPQTAYVTANVNLRGGPGTDNPVITTIPAGSAVRVGTCTLEWCAVEWNGQDGYAIARNLSPNRPQPVRRYAVQPYYRPGPPVVYAPPVYYPPPVYYRPYYSRPRYYYGRSWGVRRRW